MSLLQQLRFIIIFFLLAGAKVLTDNSNDSTCSASENGFCRGSMSVVQCRISRICQLQDLIASKNQVIELDLSSNGLENITERPLSMFSGLRELSLARNNIKVLTYQAFYGLGNLTTLNLSMNPLRKFTGNLSGLFPSLSTLDATGIVDWKPEKKLLRLRMLQRIVGLTWSAECTNCLFYRNSNETRESNLTFYIEVCYVREFVIRVRSPLYQFVRDTQFVFKCEKYGYCLRTNYYASQGLVNICWDETVIAMNCQSFLGGLSVVFNFVTFLNIITSRRLRENVCMLLVCNMAFSDLLAGLYSIAITVYLNNVTFLQSHREGQQHCWKIGIFWMLGQASAVVTSFYLTLERYLAIVYSLQPEVRITRRLAAILVIMSWLLAVSLTGIALYYNFYRFSFTCVPIRPDIVHTKVFAFTLSIGIAALILYGISFGFYVHIYFVVKRTAQDAGVRRESRLAKRIALLVFSNVVFFFIPILSLGLVFVLFKKETFITTTGHGLSKIEKVASELFVKMFPLLCLSLNSCINPVLHAFRNDSFREVLKRRFTGLVTRIRSLSNRVSPAIPTNLQEFELTPRNLHSDSRSPDLKNPNKKPDRLCNTQSSL